VESLDDLQHFTRVTLPSLKLTEQYLVLHVFALVNGRLSPGSKVRPLCVRERERERGAGGVPKQGVFARPVIRTSLVWGSRVRCIARVSCINAHTAHLRQVFMKECLAACQFWSEVADVEALLKKYMAMKLTAKVRPVMLLLRFGRLGFGTGRHWPLDDGKCSHFPGVRVALSAGYNPGEGDRRASRIGHVSSSAGILGVIVPTLVRVGYRLVTD
jgi:hypothetical protein